MTIVFIDYCFTYSNYFTDTDLVDLHFHFVSLHANCHDGHHKGPLKIPCVSDDQYQSCGDCVTSGSHISKGTCKLSYDVGHIDRVLKSQQN